MEAENVFLLIKSLHIVAVISWLAGLLYLPRLFSYHCKTTAQSEMDKTFQIMEKKLLYYITTPAMIAVILLGLGLVYFLGFDYAWLHIKLSLVLVLIGFHFFLMRCCKNFALGKNQHSEKFYRLINEVPTVIMIGIVFVVIFKPYA
jgi:protoporphyrinogen IX oxidase